MRFLIVVLFLLSGCSEIDRIMDVDSGKPCREKCETLGMDWRLARFENSIQCRCISRLVTVTEEQSK